MTDVSALGTCASLRYVNLRCSGVIRVPCREGLRMEFDSTRSGATAPSPIFAMLPLAE